MSASDHRSDNPFSSTAGARVVLWIAFAALLLASGYRLLWACTISPSAWPAALAWMLPADCRPGPDEAAAEKEKLAALMATVRQAENAVLQKAAACGPDCPAPAPPAPPPPAPVPQKKVGEILTIPPDAGNLEFLKGCWQSTSKLTNTRDNSEIVHRYCFGEDGRGTVTITNPDYRCSVEMRGTVTGGKLRIEVPQVPCNNGTTFNRSVVQCRSADQGALCDIDNFDGNGRPTSAKVRDGQFKRVE